MVQKGGACRDYGKSPRRRILHGRKRHNGSRGRGGVDTDGILERGHIPRRVPAKARRLQLEFVRHTVSGPPFVETRRFRSPIPFQSFVRARPPERKLHRHARFLVVRHARFDKTARFGEIPRSRRKDGKRRGFFRTLRIRQKLRNRLPAQRRPTYDALRKGNTTYKVKGKT